MKTNWEEQSNNEIIQAQINMNEKYEAVKLEIAALATKVNSLYKELDEMDGDYVESKKVIDKRLKY